MGARLALQRSARSDFGLRLRVDTQQDCTLPSQSTEQPRTRSPTDSPMDVGATISHYRITAKIGEGGMGEVYRARDIQVNRDVAIKVLPAAVSDNADRLRRFELEAQ